MFILLQLLLCLLQHRCPLPLSGPGALSRLPPPFSQPPLVACFTSCFSVCTLCPILFLLLSLLLQQRKAYNYSECILHAYIVVHTSCTTHSQYDLNNGVVTRILSSCSLTFLHLSLFTFRNQPSLNTLPCLFVVNFVWDITLR